LPMATADESMQEVAQGVGELLAKILIWFLQLSESW